MRRLFSILTTLLCMQVLGLDLTLYINKDSVVVDQVPAAFCAFNTTDTLNSKNAIIQLAVNEVLDLTVVNQDTITHTFTINGVLESDNEVPPIDSAQFSLSISEAGTYRYYSESSHGQLIGASGILQVGFVAQHNFYWNLFEMQPQLSLDLANGNANTIPIDFQPEYFFINGAHHPHTLDDPDALVAMQVGDTAIIAVLNSGNMEHVLHFHGFHVKVLHASHQPERVGWIKDTLPLGKGHSLTVQLVADQEGIYPVHDHNLIAVTNAGYYPGGMITQIQVTP